MWAFPVVSPCLHVLSLLAPCAFLWTKNKKLVGSVDICYIGYFGRGKGGE